MAEPGENDGLLIEGLANSEQNDSNGTTGEVIVNLVGDQLSLVAQDLTSLPLHIAQKYGKTVTRLDLSFNAIEKLEHLGHFAHLQSLVADNNRISSDQNFPKLDGLKTLSVNNNNITDLKEFIASIRDKFPNITFLSMLKNPACPNEFTGRDAEDYQRYRYYVLFRLKGLRFLDSTEVTDIEKKEAERVGSFALPARPDPSQFKRQTSPVEETPENALPAELKQEGVGKASFGVSNYIYYGRQSEGNRFIMNEDL